MDEKVQEISALGDGTQENPFLISDKDGLVNITNDLCAYYKLTDDIDLAGKAFTPIGTSSSPFKGVLDGAGHEIKNLTVNGTGNYTGLFGYLSGAVVKNLALTGVNVTGTGSYKYTGALAGYVTGGSISCCSAEGKVKGYQYVGGLVGYGVNSMVVSDSYAMGEVTYTYNSSSCYTGGLIGYGNTAAVRRCYAACRVGSYAKGLIGYTGSMTVEDSYYDGQVAKIASSTAYNNGKMSSALIRKETYINWDFEDVWKIEEGMSYPYLRCCGMEEGPCADLGGITCGVGTEEAPYLVNSAEGLDSMRHELTGWYRLASDIDMEGEAFTPIGNNSTPFRGTFDGAGHEIKNLTVSRAGDYTGLFGYLNGAVMKNLALTGVNVAGTGSYKYTGALAGYANGGSISCCSAEGKVKGYQYVGGLIGYGANSMVVSDSYAMGEVTYTYNSSSCYTGGLIGYGNTAAVRRCYAACRVGSYAKGLIGYAGSMTVEDSYYDGQVAKIASSDAYNICRMTLMFLKKEYFINWDFEGVWDIKEGESYPYLRCRGKAGEQVDLGGIIGGVGTEEAPYLVSSVQGLDSMRYEPAGWYRLALDIDMAGEAFTPVGNSLTPFTGRLDGAGHAVKNLTVSATTDYAGLFGYLKGAEVRDLALTGGQVACTKNYTGALAGYVTGGSISRCSAEGSVKGYRYVGGLAGYVGSAVVCDSYAMGDVTSTYNSSSEYAGGLIGYGSAATVSRCYAACRMTGRYPQGFIGYVSGNVTVEDCYYDRRIAQVTSGDKYNVGKMTVLLTQMKTYVSWDFEGTWSIEEGMSYPYLRCRGMEGGLQADLGGITGGVGTEGTPYLVSSAQGLDSMRYEPTGCYRLTADIDMAGEVFTPVGNSATPFKGVFDGAGHSVSNMKIETNTSYSGLFGYLDGAMVRDLTQIGVDFVSNSSYAGALAGYANNSVNNNCSVVGELLGNQYVGGLCGYINETHIAGCNIQVKLSGSSYVGGLLGAISSSLSSVNECCTNVDISAASYLGGLIGSIGGNAQIIDCYAVGSVISTSKNKYTAGLIGYGYSATVNNSYAACVISSNGSGLVAYTASAKVYNSFYDSDLCGITTPAEQARTTVEMLKKETYVDWNWNDIWTYEESHYPVLQRTKMLNATPFELTCDSLAWFSAVINWNDIHSIQKYEVLYSDKMCQVSEPPAVMDELTPDTEYEVSVRAMLNNSTRMWSKKLVLRTKRFVSVSGLHSVNKVQTSISLVWNSVPDAVRYEVIYNGNLIATDVNKCTLNDLFEDVPYEISVKAIFDDGSFVISTPIVEKIFEVNPQTDYAMAFINKCEGQNWFIDEIENLLNLKGRCINTITSPRDLSTIYAIDLSNRGISGTIPVAIGELSNLMYLYLSNNDLGGVLPEELSNLDKLIEMDLSGNHFSA